MFSCLFDCFYICSEIKYYIIDILIYLIKIIIKWLKYLLNLEFIKNKTNKIISQILINISYFLVLFALFFYKKNKENELYKKRTNNLNNNNIFLEILD
jgi:hypothetical protein